MGVRFPRRKKSQPEGGVKNACIRWLCLHGCDVISNTTGSAYREYTTKGGEQRSYRINFGKKGSGDILACSPTGKWVEIETKAGKNGQEPDQILRQQEIEKRGGIYILARSTDDLEARKSDILA